MMIGSARPTPAGVEHVNVNVAYRGEQRVGERSEKELARLLRLTSESVIARPLSTARVKPLHCLPPIVMLQGSVPTSDT